MADHEDDFAESGADGVVYGVVDDGFFIGSDAVHLFERSVARSHAGGQYQKCRFHIFLFVLLSSVLMIQIYYFLKIIPYSGRLFAVRGRRFDEAQPFATDTAFVRGLQS